MTDPRQMVLAAAILPEALMSQPGRHHPSRGGPRPGTSLKAGA
jgi:hypothetical protein